MTEKERLKLTQDYKTTHRVGLEAFLRTPAGQDLIASARLYCLPGRSMDVKADPQAVMIKNAMEYREIAGWHSCVEFIVSLALPEPPAPTEQTEFEGTVPN